MRNGSSRLLTHTSWGRQDDHRVRVSFPDNYIACATHPARSIIVNHLEQKFCHDGSVGIACIYFNYKETRSEIQLLSDIYLQLLQQHQTVPSLAKTYIERYQREGKRPTRGDLKDLVQSALKLYSRSFVVLDALDECIGDQDEPVERQAQFRKRLYETLQSFGLSVNLLVTSRVSGNIPQLFRDAMQLEISPHQNDMRAYIEQRIGEKGSSCQWTKMCQDDGGFKDQAVNTIIQKAQKMCVHFPLEESSFYLSTNLETGFSWSGYTLTPLLNNPGYDRLRVRWRACLLGFSILTTKR